MINTKLWFLLCLVSNVQDSNRQIALTVMVLMASDNLPSILTSAFSISSTFFPRDFFDFPTKMLDVAIDFTETGGHRVWFFVLSFEDVPRGGLTRSRILYLRVRLSYQTEKCATDLLFENDPAGGPSKLTPAQLRQKLGCEWATIWSIGCFVFSLETWIRESRNLAHTHMTPSMSGMWRILS